MQPIGLIVFRGEERFLFPGSRDLAMHNAVRAFVKDNPFLCPTTGWVAMWAYTNAGELYCKCPDEMDATRQLVEGIKREQLRQQKDDLEVIRKDLKSSRP